MNDTDILVTLFLQTAIRCIGVSHLRMTRSRQEEEQEGREQSVSEPAAYTVYLMVKEERGEIPGKDM